MKKDLKEVKDKTINNVKRALSVGAGAITGKLISDFVQKRSINQVSGEEEDLLGLPAKVSKYSTPGIVMLIGAGAALLSKNQIAKDASLGVMASGAVGLTQAAFNKDFSSLKGADEPVELVYGNIPGVGDVNYEELPTANQAAQTYIPEIPATNELAEMAGFEGMDGEDFDII